MVGNAKNPKPKNGINPGGWLDIIFTLGNTNVDQLLKRLRNGSLGVGVHVQSYASGGSESFVIKPTPAPLPAAGWLMCAGLISWLGLSRRRRG